MRTRKEYLLIRSGRKGEGKAVAGVFSSIKKAREAIVTSARLLSEDYSGKPPLLEFTPGGARLVHEEGGATWEVLTVVEDAVLIIELK